MSNVLIRQWWNGIFGRLARCDVIVWANGDRTRWMVEARLGGRDGRSRYREVANAHEAHALATRWREVTGVGEWKDITPLLTRPRNREDQG